MKKTTQVAADRAYDQTKTVLPAEVARGVYMRNAPSLAALKLMHLMIGVAGGRMAEPVRHEIRLSDIRKIRGMDNHTRASLTPLFEELRAVVIREGSPDVDVDLIVVGGLLDHAVLNRKDPISGDTLLSWFFGRSFLEMAEKSCHWAILDRQTVFHLASKYSVLLFQHIASLVNLNHIESKIFTVPELRAMFGVTEGKLSRFADLRRFAIEPAIAEINQLSRFTLTAMPKKIGRTVASIEISWVPKEDSVGIKKELGGHSAGRKARRGGLSETLSVAFPAAGSIEFSRPWNEIAKLHGNGKDKDLIAQDFRNWCLSQCIPLDKAGIEKTFEGFCKRAKV